MKKILAITITLCCFQSLYSQSEIEKVTETVSKNTIEGHIYFLADDLLKGRETGTAENKIAASYLANSLRSYGIQPNPKTGTYYQNVALQKVHPPKNWMLNLNGNSAKQKVIIKQAKLEYRGEAVYLGYGLEDDYKGKDVKKQLIIIKAGGPESNSPRAAFRLRRQKEKLAKAAGALGVIELIKAETTTWSFIERNFNNPGLDIVSARVSLKALAERQENKIDESDLGFAYVWVQDEYGTLVLDLEAKPTIGVQIEMGFGKIETINSQNVIGTVEGTDPNLKKEYIIYSAHYDHVGIGSPDATGDTIYNGARDNAVGTTTVLSMAQHLAKYPTKRSALFILFTAEEKGLLGSKYYVENPVLPLKQMVYCFNSDNGGYNDITLATIIGLERTTAQQNIVDAAKAFGLRAIEDPAPEQGLFDRSDNVNFAVKGIPSPTFSMGFSSFDGDVTKYYHQPGDHADSLDYDYLLKFFRAYVLAGRNIGNDDETPFWTKGDKYETAGKKLYGN